MNIYQDLPVSPKEQVPVRPSKAKRLRFVWFMLGIGAGIIFTRALDATIEYSEEIAQEFGSVETLQSVLIDGFSKSENEPAADSRAELKGSTTANNDTNTVAKNDEVIARSKSVPAYPKQIVLAADKGDTLLDMLSGAGLADEESYKIIKALGPVYNPRKLRPSHKFAVTVDKVEGSKFIAQKLVIALSPLEEVVLSRSVDGSFKSKKNTLPLINKTVRAGGIITSSLYQTAKNSGIPENMVAELINAYSYDVDFQRDIKHGDAVEVLFEQKQTESGKVVTGSRVLHATLTIGGKKIPVYRYTDSKGNSGYYDGKGQSVRKALLRTPVNGARISSRFGKRRHPILGYTKMHKGLDFAAPTGTPIYAAGDGIVERASRHGGYGKYVRIKHNGKYSTAYAHLSRFGKNIRNGRRVKQGQVIGYVGSTGRSTGPHLHYEILAYGKQINPSGVKFKTGRTLKGKELARFKEHARDFDSQIASLPRIRTEVATAGGRASSGLR